VFIIEQAHFREPVCVQATSRAVLVAMDTQPPPPQPALSVRESIDFELLYLLEQEPGLSQRELSQRLGLSLGRVNYCVKALTGKGWLKLTNFRNSNSKLRYVYVLTPSGIAQRVSMTSRFLQRKKVEYDRLKRQIELLANELPGDDERRD
jgi:EPS-associated MarR family transcriptional regulator